MLSGYKKQSSEWLLDEIIKEANEVEFPSDSNLLFELRSELLSRLTKDALDGANCPACGEPKAAAALHEFCYPPEHAPQVI